MWEIGSFRILKVRPTPGCYTDIWPTDPHFLLLSNNCENLMIHFIIIIALHCFYPHLYAKVSSLQKHEPWLKLVLMQLKTCKFMSTNGRFFQFFWSQEKLSLRDDYVGYIEWHGKVILHIACFSFFSFTLYSLSEKRRNERCLQFTFVISHNR